MPEEQKPDPYDFSTVEFPSDRLTLGQIRRQEPEIMTSHRQMGDRHPADIDALDACRMEHILAKKVWAKVVGMPDPHPRHIRREEVDNLSHIYKRYGISKGKLETNEIIRRFEADVERAAKLSMGEGRG